MSCAVRLFEPTGLLCHGISHSYKVDQACCAAIAAIAHHPCWQAQEQSMAWRGCSSRIVATDQLIDSAQAADVQYQAAIIGAECNDWYLESHALLGESSAA